MKVVQPEPDDPDFERAEPRAVLDAMRAPFRDVSPTEIEQETNRIVREIREERRRAREISSPDS